ncbi:MAG: hypothetical protein GWN73_01400, partial [Actinobacteria bacterium]|nr:hypothetical protein [Actinomycetota bacterium]NIS35430.1 hypothetical protein [Actinomycetota bacterium]NIU64158.1 hypothetical protein [Actinomycetota bacterium]NIW25956.1 hypothetical protein [Actinomycetota bacterium]
MGSDSVDLRTVRDVAGAVTDITSAEGPVRPSWYGPAASGPDADRGVVLPEKLGEVLAPYQFVLVANALVADTRLLGTSPGWIQAGLVAAGGALADVKLFELTR